MSIKRVITPGIGLVMILGLFTLPVLNSCATPEATMAKDYPIPPIDQVRPAVTETAAFAMG